jgi:hypothetical protein
VLLFLTLFNAVLGLRQEGKAGRSGRGQERGDRARQRLASAGKASAWEAAA